MVVGSTQEAAKLPLASTVAEQTVTGPDCEALRTPMVTESAGVKTGQPLPLIVTVLPDAALWVLVAETRDMVALETVNATLAALGGLALSVTVSAVGPDAKPLGTVKVRPLNCPREPVLVMDGASAVLPNVTVSGEFAAKPPPLSVTGFVGLA